MLTMLVGRESVDGFLPLPLSSVLYPSPISRSLHCQTRQDHHSFQAKHISATSRNAFRPCSTHHSISRMILSVEPPNSLSSTTTTTTTTSTNDENGATGINSNNSNNTPFYRRPVLAILDFIALFVFAGIGKASHAMGEQTTIVQEVIGIAQTALPFIVAWFITSFFTGVYNPLSSITFDNRGDDGESIENVSASQSTSTSSVIIYKSWKQTIQGWCIAIPLGCIGRGIIKGYIPPVPFVIVTIIATLIILGIIRMIYNYSVTIIASN